MTNRRNSRGNGPNAYESSLLQAIVQRPFLPAVEATQLLKANFSVTSAYARKILERAVINEFLKSSKPFTFGKGQFVYFDPQKELDKQTTKDLSYAYRPTMFRLIQTLDENGGIISYYEALKVTAAPIEPTSSKVDQLDDLLRILLDLNIIHIRMDEHDVRYILDKETTNRLSDEECNNLIRSHYAGMYLDSLFLPDIFRWLTRINLVARRQKPNYRNKNAPSLGAVHNVLVWDGFTYSKTTGINEELGKYADAPEKQTFVALDVIISRPYVQTDLDGFLARIQIYRNSVKVGARRVLPIVVYRETTPHILNILSSLGMLNFDIGVVFGTHIFKVVEQMQLIQINRHQASKADWEETIFTALANLRRSGQEENLNELKGTLFELLLYPILRHLYPSAEISHGRILSSTENGQKTVYEYDYIIRSSNPREIVVVELKGYQGGAVIPKGSAEQKSTLDWFFRRTLPFARKVFQAEVDNGYQFRGCYITSGGFRPDGIAMLEEVNRGSFKPAQLDIYYDGQKLLQLLKKLDFSKAAAILQQYYLEVTTPNSDLLGDL